MSTPPAPRNQQMLAVLATDATDLDARPQDEGLIQCAGGCGRVVAQQVRLCVGCRNTSQHPALWGKRAARS